VLYRSRRLILALTCLGLVAFVAHAGTADAADQGRPAPGELIAYKVLAAAHGGTVTASNGAAIKVPPGVMSHNGVVTITRIRGDRYDMNIASPWKGRVAVTLPAHKRSRGIIHLIGSTWVREGRAGQRTVWVHQLSLFSWATNKLKAATCFVSLSIGDIIECLAGKGISKIDSGLTKWLAEKTGISTPCGAQILASKGFVSALFNALTGACVVPAGESGGNYYPPPSTPPASPAPTPTAPAPTSPPPTSPPPSTPPAAAPPTSGVNETTGGLAHTWTNYTNAGGYEGPAIPSNATVLISCRLTGFRVADGNTWWYRIASAPWSNVYYVSADAFYNNGQTSGSLIGTPFVDPAVPTC
jgi:hypothetical protein